MTVPRGYCVDTAHRHLRAVDPELKRWIRRIGPMSADPRWTQRFDLVDALARAILFQQLSGKAAATIVGRVERACGGRVLRADRITSLSDEALRSCGVSRNKSLALRDLCARALDGELPRTAELNRLPEDAIVERLVTVRGIGRWTVEMLLMSRLGRPDVFPVDDLGIRKGVARLRGLAEMPTPKQTMELGAVWAPYRSLACSYLWRIADAA
ncbi:MAG: DNA-3-methyladenine glycosylase 2 family protein [Xanthomonadales bacterium]|nr:DNA-3-methyladenine glycosylase 2 family protein [Xanthomonadales bacterium]